MLFMKYVKNIRVKLPSIFGIDENFELGDLTIFIGKSNSGKTRILNNIYSRLNSHGINARNNNFAIFLEGCKNDNIIIDPDFKKILKVVLVNSPRQNIPQIGGLSVKLSRTADSLKVIDPTVSDFGPDVLQFSNGETRKLSEQGTGVHNQVQILDALHNPSDVVLIDEPEISQFPYGKIEILRNIINELDKKQVILATHDPTIINQFIIKKMVADKSYKIVLYSFCGDKFKKIDYYSTCDPEIHVGYLNQTYSSKPVHLIVEGQTEFYALQALLTQYCIFNKIPNFPQYLNRISISYMGGSQWKINKHHLPDSRYYNTLILLDGEYSEDVKNELPDNQFNVINSLNDVLDDKINVITLNSENFDKAFEKVFGEQYTKPIKLSEKIWSLKEEEFRKIDFSDKDIFTLIKIIQWCLKNAGSDYLPEEPIAEVIKMLKARKITGNRTISKQYLVKLASKRFLASEIKDAIEKLLRNGFLYELKPDFISIPKDKWNSL